MEHYLNVLKKYAVFDGRARRTEYWMFILINAGIALLLSFLSAIFEDDLLSGFFMIILSLYYIAMIIPSLAAAVRRLHDIGKSGWWIFITIVPLIGPIWNLVNLLTDSQPGDNQYGPNPKGINAIASSQVPPL